MAPLSNFRIVPANNTSNGFDMGDIKIGDRIVVHGQPIPAYVERIEFEASTKRTIIFLDWREFGKSKVYLHDQNSTWHKYINLN